MIKVRYAMRPLLTVVVWIAASLALAQDLIPWQSSFIAARRGASASDMMLVAVFAAEDDLGRMQMEAFQDAALAKKLASFVPVRVDPTKDTFTTSQYRVKQHPIILVLEPQGQVRGHIVGPIDAETLAKELDRINRLNRSFSGLSVRATSGNASRTELEDAAIAYALRFDLEESRGVMEFMRERGISAPAMASLAQAYMLRGGTRAAAEWYSQALSGLRDPAQRAYAKVRLAGLLETTDMKQTLKLLDEVSSDAKAPEVAKRHAAWLKARLGG